MTIDRLVDLVAAAARAGIDLIQIRERDLDARRADRARAGDASTRSKERGTKVLVNDRADVALAAGAHGVHLRGDSIAARGGPIVARRRRPDRPIGSRRGGEPARCRARAASIT